MSFGTRTWFWPIALIGALVLVLAGSQQGIAREAAFMDPATAGNSTPDEAIKVEPKGDIDTGESVLNVAKRTSLFFVNQTAQPVQVESTAVNGDGNVTAEITNDDCSKQKTIPPLSRCSLEVSVTPSTPGPWSVDALLTHSGAGRIARAKLTGKTSGTTTAGEKKDTGLALSTKEINPVNFGDVEIGQGKAVRSALMVNDSPEPITIYSIDVIAAENGLERLDQGCAVDMELKQGESCPVTLKWVPETRGQISTDLIIRHSGRLGFAVIPIRGNAKGNPLDGTKDKDKDKDKSDNKMSVTASDMKSSSLPTPPTAQDLAKAVDGKISAVSADALSASSTATSTASGILRLIGTVGNRAVLLLPDGTTAVVASGDAFDAGDKKGKVLVVNAKSADVSIDGKKKKLTLEAAPELTAKGAHISGDAMALGAATGPGASGPSATGTGLLGGTSSGNAQTGTTPVPAKGGAAK